MADQFEIIQDGLGNLSVRGGLVRNLDATVIIEVGEIGGDPQFVGGNGLNLVLSGFPEGGPNGVWIYDAPDRWKRGIYTLTVSAGAGSIDDGTDEVATLATGAPEGDYDSTAYGETLLGAAFTATAAAEFSAPGTIPDAEVTVSAGTAQDGTFEPTADNVWTHTTETDWTITINPATGRAEMEDGTAVVAVREEGPTDHPAGTYEATAYGRYTYHPDTPDPGDDPGTPPASPDDWTPDDPDAGSGATDPDDEEVFPTDDPPDPELDPDPEPEVAFDTLTLLSFHTVGIGGHHAILKVRFLSYEVSGATVGSDTYLALTDPTPPAGEFHQQVVIDLPAASAAEEITTDAVIEVYCDSDSIGDPIENEVTLAITYKGVTRYITLAPGVSATVDTLQTVLGVPAFDIPEDIASNAWRAIVAPPVAVTPPEGVVYLKVTEDTGVLDTVDGPFFAAALPSNTTDVYHVTLGDVDADGKLRQLWTGPMLWRDA